MSEKQVKRVIDVNYDGFQSLPRWRRVVQEVVSNYVKEHDPESLKKRLRVRVNPISSMPESRMRIEVDPPQNIDTEELAGLVIERLRTLELSFILEEKRVEIESEYHKHRDRWEDSEIIRRKAWEERADGMHREYLSEYQRDVNGRREWETEEARKRREFELEMVNDETSRSKWENDNSDKLDAAQKKLTILTVLAGSALVFSIISIILSF